VREAVGDPAADGLAGAKKDAMASAAEGLVAGTGWLPVPLRTGKADGAADAGASGDAACDHEGCDDARGHDADADEGEGDAAALAAGGGVTEADAEAGPGHDDGPEAPSSDGFAEAAE